MTLPCLADHSLEAHQQEVPCTCIVRPPRFWHDDARGGKHRPVRDDLLKLADLLLLGRIHGPS